MTILDRLAETLQQGDIDVTTGLITRATAEGIPAQTILNRGLIAGMNMVGKKFQTGEIFIPHMLLAARAMHAAIAILKPALIQSGAKPVGRVVLGTVRGDHHDIGKNLVAIMLEGRGFEVVDIGIDAAPEAFVAAIDPDVRIVAMSALLSTTAVFMEETIEAICCAGLRDQVRIMVGGGVITRDFALKIGADAYGADAAVAADIALGLMDSNP